MPLELIITPISSELLPLCSVFSGSAPDPWDIKDLTGEMSIPSHFGYAAMCKSNVVAFVFFSLQTYTAELLQFVVSANYRGMGIGTALLAATLPTMRDKGAERCLLEVRCGNAPAIALYKNMGFNTIAVRKDMYASPKENGYLMEKKY